MPEVDPSKLSQFVDRLRHVHSLEFRDMDDLDAYDASDPVPIDETEGE
jgi:hypothetical protein